MIEYYEELHMIGRHKDVLQSFCSCYVNKGSCLRNLTRHSLTLLDSYVD